MRIVQIQLGHRIRIEYILITDEMREGGVWWRKNEGLLFLLNTDYFERVFDSESVEVYRVVYSS